MLKRLKLRSIKSTKTITATAFTSPRRFDGTLNIRLTAGEPARVEAHVDEHMSLSSHMVRREEDTFCVMVSGKSMLDPGDILVVDRGLNASDGKTVIAAVDSELTVIRLQKADSHITLLPENIAYKAIEINEENNFHIWN